MNGSERLTRLVKRIRGSRSQRWLANSVGVSLDEIKDLENGVITSDEVLDAFLDYIDWDRSADEFLEIYY